MIWQRRRLSDRGKTWSLWEEKMMEKKEEKEKVKAK